MSELLVRENASADLKCTRHSGESRNPASVEGPWIPVPAYYPLG